MNYDDWNAQIPAYALGTLDAHEAAALEQQLATDPSLRASLVEYQQVIGNLAIAVAPIEPPARAKAALMSSVREQAAPAGVASQRPRRQRSRRSWVWVPRVAFASAVCVVLIMGAALAITTAQLRQALATSEQTNAQLTLTQTALATLRTEQQALATQLAVAQQYANQSGAALAQRTNELRQITQQIEATQQTLVFLSADTVTSRSLHAVGSGTLAQGAMFMKPGQRDAVILVRGLPKLGQAQTYQFWLADSVHQVNAGTIDVDASGIGHLLINVAGPVDTFAAIMITIEQREQAPMPSDQVVLQGQL